MYWKNESATYLAVILNFVSYTQSHVLPYYCIVLGCYVFKLLTKAIKAVEINIKMKQEILSLFS